MRLFDVAAAASVKRGHVLLVNVLAALMFAFTTTSINVALPDIQMHFHLSAVSLGWLPLGYILASAAFLLPFGRVGDRLGRRLIFLGGLVLFFLSTVALVFANSYPMLLAFRLGQGVAGSMTFATSVAIVTVAYPPAKRGMVMGISVGAAYLGQTIGPAVGGVIVDSLGWRSLFLVTAGIAFATLGLDLYLLRRADWKEQTISSFDLAGSVTYAIALIVLMLGLSWVPSTSGIVALVAGILGLVLFVRREAKIPEPILAVHLFRRNRVFALSNLAALISYASVWAMPFLMPLYLQFIKGWSAQDAGLVLISGVALQCLISPFTGRLSDRVEPRWVASAGMFLCMVALFLFSLLRADTATWYIIVALCLLGVGYGFFSGPNQSSIVGSVERRYVGLASASISTVRAVGMAVSVAVATMIMALVVGNHTIQPADYPHLLTAVRITFALLTGLCAIAVVMSLVRGKMPVFEPEDAAGDQETAEESTFTPTRAGAVAPD